MRRKHENSPLTGAPPPVLFYIGHYLIENETIAHSHANFPNVKRAAALKTEHRPAAAGTSRAASRRVQIRGRNGDPEAWQTAHPRSTWTIDKRKSWLWYASAAS